MTFECSRVPAPLVFQHIKYFGFRGPTQLLNPNIFEPGSGNSRGNDVFTSVYFVCIVLVGVFSIEFDGSKSARERFRMDYSLSKSTKLRLYSQVIKLKVSVFFHKINEIHLTARSYKNVLIYVGIYINHTLASQTLVQKHIQYQMS